MYTIVEVMYYTKKPLFILEKQECVRTLYTRVYNRYFKEDKDKNCVPWQHPAFINSAWLPTIIYELKVNKISHAQFMQKYKLSMLLIQPPEIV